MSKLEEQKALPRRKLFKKALDKVALEKHHAQTKRLQAQGLYPKPAGSKLHRMAQEGHIGRSHLGINPDAKKAKGKR